MKRNLLSRVISVFMLIEMVFSSVPAPAYAALYSPGETLNPSCAPTDTNCDVITSALKGRLSEALTGTVSVSPGSSLVIGSSTAFTTELSAGDAIKIGSNIFTVSSISSNTSLALGSAVATTTATTTGATAYRDPTTLFSVAKGDSANVLTVSKAGFLSLVNALSITGTGTSTFSGGLSMAGAKIGTLSGLLFGTSGSVGSIATSSLGMITTNVAEGVNLYYTDTRSRNALSSSALGLTYATTTGAFSLASGYNIPLTASTTNWNTAYNWGNHATAGYVSSSTAFVNNGNSFGGLATLGTTDNNTLRFVASSTEAMRILANGNIGIGTTTPSTKLTVAGGFSVSTQAQTGTQPNPNLDTGNGTTLGTAVGGTDTVVRYTTTGITTFTPPTGITNVRVLVVAGGGSGGQGTPSVNVGAGGAGGTARASTTYAVTAGTPISITVGAGGPAGTSGSAGNNSTFGTITAAGGGRGGGTGGSSRTGGANADFVGSTESAGVNAGGGAGATENGGTDGAGQGGDGVSNDITDITPIPIYGGGGGGFVGANQAGGDGGGGANNSSGQGVSGTDGFGGGGGGGNSASGGGAGGSGVVIVRFATQSAPIYGESSALSVSNNGTTTISGALNIGNLSGLLLANAGAVSNFATSTATNGQVLGITGGALAWVTPTTPSLASATVDGLISTTTQTFAGAKTFGSVLTVNNNLVATGTLTISGTATSSIAGITLLGAAGQSAVLGKNATANRLRVTAGTSDTSDNTQGASIDLHTGGGGLHLVGGANGDIEFWAGSAITNAVRASVSGTTGLFTINSGLTTSGTTTLTGLTGLVSANASGVLSGVATSTLGIALSDTTGILAIARGGTGTSTAPSYGRLLLGNASGGYDLVATSTLGISGGSSLTGTTGQTLYFSGTNTPTATSTLFLSSAGNVGIGTTNPSNKLTVAGTFGVVSEVTTGTNPNLNSGSGAVDTTTVSGQTIITYTNTATTTFTAPTGVSNVRILAVAGGGGGGNNHGGGGGAGEYFASSTYAVGSTAITVTVGAGGAAQATNGAQGNDGVDTSFGALTLNGGGGGGGRDGGPGKTGGSGGGGSAGSDGTPTTGGASSVTGGGLGNNGGAASGSGGSGGLTGGGGGSSAGTGVAGTNTTSGTGGAGTANNITGSSVNYAAGGTGGAYLGNSTAGATQDGAGAGSNSGNAGNATANRGSGGGGGGSANGDGGAGGSGVVIVRFATVAATTTTNTSLAVDSSGNTNVNGNLSIGSLSGLLVANSGAVSNFATSTATTGQVLGIQSGALAWVNQSAGGSATTTINGAFGPAFTFNAGAGLAISTSTNSLTFTPNYAGATTDGIVSTSTQTFAGNKTFSGALTVNNNFTATGTTTLATTTASRLTLAGLSGLISANASGVLGNIATSTLGIAISDTTGILAASRGGTGFAATTTANRLLLTNASGGYDLVATSSLGISGGSSQWTTATNDIYYNTGNVAIGTSTPSASARLLVYGTAGNTTNPGLNSGNGTTLGTAIGGTDTVIRYTATGTTTFIPPTGVTNVRVLVIAGGGSGGQGTPSVNVGAGGAGGTARATTTYAVTAGTPISVTVGAGGPAGLSGTAGDVSRFGTLTATSGGRGGGATGASRTGGANADFVGSTESAGVNAGGGAGAAENGGTDGAGQGGDGVSNDIIGTFTFYGGGGGGFVGASQVGGDGGGGANNSSGQGVSGTDGFGGGGGGGNSTSGGGAGGSGVVIVRFATVNVAPSDQTLFQVTNAGTDTNSVLAFFETGASQSCIIAGQTGLSCSSDKNLKKDIEATDGVLGNVLTLKPVTYNWRAAEELGVDGFDPYAVAEGVTGDNVGFIAQDVEKIFPGLVRLDPNGNRTLAYDKFAPIIVAALQEQYGGMMGVNIASVMANGGSVDDLFTSTTTLATLDDENYEYSSIISNPVGYITERVSTGIKVARALVAEKMIAVEASFKRIFANELCLTDASGQLVCVTGENLKQIGGQTRALTPAETASVSNQIAPATVEATVAPAETAPVEEQVTDVAPTVAELSALSEADLTSSPQADGEPEIAPADTTTKNSNPTREVVSEETIMASEPVSQPSPEASAGEVEAAPVVEAPISSEPIIPPSEESAPASAPSSGELMAESAPAVNVVTE